MTLRRALGQGKQRLHKTGTWLLHEFPKAPGLELYSRHINRDNAWLTRFLRHGGGKAFQDYATPYLNRDIPRILWIFWSQGEEEAPLLVRHCIASWRLHHPDWDIRVLDSQSAAMQVDLTDIPPHLPLRFHANLLRLRLLAKYGGVWTDATTWCHRPLEDWLPLLGGQTGFFVFSGPHSDRWIDNWFIAAHPDNPLIGAWRDAYAPYVAQLRSEPSKYFMMIYIFQWSLLRNKVLMQHFRRRGSLPAVPCFLLQAALEKKIDLGVVQQAIQRGLPVSKLSWKAPVPLERLDKILDSLSEPALNAVTFTH